MHVQRTEIVSILRSRGLDARADWVERTLAVTIDQNASVLRTLGVDPAAMVSVDGPRRPA